MVRAVRVTGDKAKRSRKVRVTGRVWTVEEVRMMVLEPFMEVFVVGETGRRGGFSEGVKLVWGGEGGVGMKVGSPEGDWH